MNLSKRVELLLALVWLYCRHGESNASLKILPCFVFMVGADDLFSQRGRKDDAAFPSEKRNRDHLH